jgi:ubiquinone/menaquinone biosynthesis C-methylase UbiE
VSETDRIYREHHARHSADRNDILHNRGVLFQDLAGQTALIRALGWMGFEPGQTVLDVGGAGGGSLVPFMALRCPAATLTCVDTRDHSAEISGRFPGVTYRTCDAQALPFPDASFDVVYASHVFLQIVNDDEARNVAREMRRVVKPGGHILVRDWAIAHPRRAERAVTRRRMESLFGLPLAHIEKGAIPPPVGRWISAYAPWVYFLAQPFLGFGRAYVMKAS